MLRHVRKLAVVLTAAALVLAAAAARADAYSTHPEGFAPAPPTTVMTPATSVAARTDRRPVAGGVYDAGTDTTFIAWGGAHEDNYVQAYQHRTRTWSAPVRVASGDGDSHNYPTLVQADDGHLLVFRGLHNKELWVARSPNAHSIDGTWTDTIIPAGLGATYPMPFKTADGTIFVFIRETAGDFDKTYPTDTRPMKYVRSTDNGLTWQSSETLTGDKWNIAPLGRADNMNEIYIGQLRYEPAFDRVAIVYTLAGGGPEGHLHDRYHRNIYYTYFTPRDLHFHAADGRDLGTRIDDAEQEAYLKVVETPLQPVNPRSPDYISLVGTTFGVSPFVVWMQLDETGLVHDHAAVFTGWPWGGTGASPGGSGWYTREIGTGARIRDMEQSGPATWRVYATNDAAPSGIDTYQLFGGFVWHHESTIPTPKAVQRIDVIGDHRDPARILATGASSDRDVAVADGDIYVAGR